MFSTSQTGPRELRAPAPSIISDDVIITGILRSDGDIQVDGRVDGDVRAASLVIGEKAEIHGQLEAETVVVRGRVEGSIRARKVSLAADSHVEGDILYESLEVQSGAFVQGAFRHCADPLALTLPALESDQAGEDASSDRRRPGSAMRPLVEPDVTEIRKAS
jgi:cytoskeletal protein CcmA (bactofilin family)